MGFHLFSNSGQIQYGIKNYIADFKTDLKNIPKNPGNMVFVIEESKYYITNNKQDWVEYKVNNSTEESDIEIDITENGSHDVSFATTANVNVPQGVFPEGNQIITENGNYNITLKETVDINVPQGIFPEGTKQINLTSNGTTTYDVTNYTNAEIAVNTLPAKGLVFEDYDSDGYPHSVRFVGTWTTIPQGFLQWIFNCDHYSFVTRIENPIVIPEGVTTIEANSFYNFKKQYTLPSTLKNINSSGLYGSGLDGTSLILPEGLTSIGSNGLTQSKFVEITLPESLTTVGNDAFISMQNLKRVIYKGQPVGIYFRSSNNIEYYDFSHATAIPALSAVNALGHKSGAVLSIPLALSDTTLGEGNGWESETNWDALTDIVWEVV